MKVVPEAVDAREPLGDPVAPVLKVWAEGVHSAVDETDPVVVREPLRLPLALLDPEVLCVVERDTTEVREGVAAPDPDFDVDEEGV